MFYLLIASYLFHQVIGQSSRGNSPEIPLEMGCYIDKNKILVEPVSIERELVYKAVVSVLNFIIGHPALLILLWLCPSPSYYIVIVELNYSNWFNVKCMSRRQNEKQNYLQIFHLLSKPCNHISVWCEAGFIVFFCNCIFKMKATGIFEIISTFFHLSFQFLLDLASHL